MRYAVIGAGPIGSAIAATLFANGNDVSLIDVAQTIVDAISANGLYFENSSIQFAPPDMQKVVNIPIFNNPERVGKVDVVFLAVKGVFTRNCIATMKALMTPETIFISAQNGIGNEEIMAEALGAENVAYTVVQYGGRLLGPGRISCNIPVANVTNGMEGHLPVTSFLAKNAKLYEKLKQVGKDMTSSWFDCRPLAKNQLDSMRWSKLILNAVVNSIGAVAECPMDGQYACESGVQFGEKIIEEGIAVAEALGVKVKREDIHLPNKVEPKVTDGGYRHYTSMAMDVVNRRKTENEFINGAIVRTGRKVGVPTPYNQAIYWMVDVVENTYEDRFSITNKV